MAVLPVAWLPLAVLLSISVDGGFLGVRLEDRDGPTVIEVIRDTAAARAGIRAGDRFLAIDETKTPTVARFLAVLGKYDAGDRVTLTFQRGDKTMEKEVRLGRRPANLEEPQEEARHEETEEAKEQAEQLEAKAQQEKAHAEAREQRADPGQLQRRGAGKAFLGVTVGDAQGGVKIDSVLDGSPAARAGLRAGDVITRVGENRVGDADQLGEVLDDLRPGRRVRIEVQRGSTRKRMNLTLGSVPVESRPMRVREPEEPKAAKNRDAAREADERAMAKEGAAAKAREVAKQRAIEKEREAAKRQGGSDAASIARLRQEVRELRAQIRELRELLRRRDR